MSASLRRSLRIQEMSPRINAQIAQKKTRRIVRPQVVISSQNQLERIFASPVTPEEPVSRLRTTNDDIQEIIQPKSTSLDMITTVGKSNDRKGSLLTTVRNRQSLMCFLICLFLLVPVLWALVMFLLYRRLFRLELAIKEMQHSNQQELKYPKIKIEF